MGISSTNTTAQSARNGDSRIVPQGQTAGDYGNDPFKETRQGKAGYDESSKSQLKP